MDHLLCAVMNCPEPGRPQVCPYDGSLHGHGMIHYEEGYPISRLTFRAGWHLICEEHYAVLDGERKAWVTANRLIESIGGA